ncbi:hydroxymethylglutaryl-CoA lyase [Congregibacter variabilis]|uniref:hydroxymethylglutaryl-CoA lyase n=1 Tax=Congregibacter variabilis TaxID=3081200 RepID=A0ABZ0I109_9GAMM|nr:hydroxymethylglutaryl-CoA lyase [Congregibacter sp. IMCC43200]
MSSASYPPEVSLIEVGPRDGLQNESTPLPTEDKVTLVEGLVAAGLRYVETGSFVNPRWIPQMADSADVFKKIARTSGVTYAALTPNLQGFERAMEAGASEVAVFAAASESFSQRNINCSISESIERFRTVMDAAKTEGVAVRGYVSCVLGCPYEGRISPSAVLSVSEELLTLGCYEVSLGDTIGTGTPGSMDSLLSALIPALTAGKLALHCHNSYGQALANILVGLQHGITRVDSSVAGLGGCPYATGASGNVATEDVVYMLQGLGIKTGVDLDALITVGASVCNKLGRASQSAVAKARSS